VAKRKLRPKEKNGRTGDLASAVRAIKIILLATIAFGSLGTAGCQNILSESAQKTTDQALLYEAQKLIDREEYGTAIETIGSMSASARELRNVKRVLASAYAGVCGLNLLELADALSNSSSDSGSGSSASTLFQMLLSIYKEGTAASVAACNEAENTLLGISATASSRTVDENVLLAFIEFVKIGVVLEINADKADHDGSVDGAFDSCASDATGISDLDVGEIGTGLTIALSSLQAASVNTATGATGSIAALCSTLDATIGVFDPSYSGFCDKTDPTAFNAVELKALRSLTRSNEIGLKTCDDTLVNCLCQPFP